jgi:hypothetical protein
MTSEKEIVLSPETLDAVYQNWLRSRSDEEPRYISRRSYQRGYRDGLNRYFEDWLWENGFKIFQKDKKRYLLYMGTDSKLSLFLLKYGS